jgi:hypothetical protein
VDDHVELPGLGLAGSLDADLVPVFGLLDRGDRRGAQKFDPDLSASGDEEFDEVGVETLEGTGSAVDDDRAVPARAEMWANSKEMKPPPTNKIRGGRTPRSRKSVLSTRCW